MNLQNKYSRDEFLSFISSFIPNFGKDVRKINTQGSKTTTEAHFLGESPDLDLAVFELTHASSRDARVTLATEGFKLMKDSANFRALIAYIPEKSNDWRLSLMTATPDTTEKGKVILKLSNPRRYSFFLGESAKVNTPYQFLIKQDGVADFEELQKRFSLEVVNKDFYKEVSQAFTQLVNGQLKLPFVNDMSQTHLEFAVRLIGRIIFCWFLREKKSETGLPLMPQQILSLDAVKQNEDYYHSILEPIFFEVLNKPIKLRKDDFVNGPFSSVPYLNGGLFSPQEDDYYKRNNGDLQSQFHNTLIIPDKWLMDFFETLETYNFTIDENTSFDEELSIDPEMLGRIFENLLAEINPETGESARKSTGSYYTPRTIVNYMVDESLVLYLKEKTGLNEIKLRAVISYDLNDDSEYPLNAVEKEKIIEELEKVKILDPACGSGAFPIGALQKIVFILQQIDPDGQLWFKKQIENTQPEVKRIIEREFSHKNFDYIRKLGIIRENIYGVDIQPIATEISRLRCFLTLVVDERIQDDAENRGIEPLPNLDFKFVTANSLIGLPGSSGANQMGLFEDDKGIKDLKELRDSFFNANGAERDQLKLEFVQSQNRMFQRMIQEGRKGYADLTTMLSGWEPFTHRTSSWFEPEWMFGIKNGFDIVIANPPWVSLSGKQALEENRNSAPLLKKLFKGNTYMPNLYEYFILKSLSFLNQTGLLTFIVPDRFGYNESSTLLRKRILSEYTLVDIVYRWKFEAIIADTMTFLIQNKESHPNDVTKIRYTPEDTQLSISSFELLHNTNYAFNSYVNDDVRNLVKKIRSRSEKLINYCKTTSGFGGKSELVTESRISKKQIEVLKGRSIRKYSIVKKYYFDFVDENITGRTRDINKLSVKEKVLLRKTGDSIIAAYDESGAYPEQSLYFTYRLDPQIKIKYLLAILNSKLITWFYLNELVTNIDSTPQLKQYDLDSFPIIKALFEDQNQLVKSVDQIMKAVREGLSVEEQQTDIDQFVCKLYGLTEEEKKIVEGKND